jgi:hypothetical protein
MNAPRSKGRSAGYLRGISSRPHVPLSWHQDTMSNQSAAPLGTIRRHKHRTAVPKSQVAESDASDPG